MKEEEKQEKKDPMDLVNKTIEAAERLERANKEAAELLLKQTEAKTEAILAGTSEAGTKQQEDTPEEYAAKVMANEIESKDA